MTTLIQIDRSSPSGSTVRFVDFSQAEIGSILGGLGAALGTVFAAYMKARTDSALKQIEVSGEWQRQMLDRIAALEQKVEVERRRRDAMQRNYDSLQREHLVLRRDYEHLREENKSLEEEAWQARERLAVLDHRNAELELHNITLRTQLKKIHEQVQDLQTIPPLARLKKDGGNDRS